MLAFQVQRLVYLQKAPSPPRGEVTSLQRTILDTHLNWVCLIDPYDGLNLMSNLESFFKSFYFYLFKSFYFYQMISNYHLNLNFIFILSLILIFQFEY